MENQITPLVLFISILFSFLNSEIEGNSEIVTITQGKLKGIEQESRNGTKFHAFLGIPYAKPPIGKLRFSPPQETDSWYAVKNANEEPPLCIQKENYFKFIGNDYVFGQEDCLYLNVYSPQIRTEHENSKFPVLFWIHGGGFIEGAGSLFLPDYFMDYNVVVVTINYRLGILGFLSTGDKTVPGNNGMKDQVAALKWVQKNIASFGGDPDKVTIFGESAGGASVHHHLLSPLSKGLFHRAISQSGTALAFWGTVSQKKSKQNLQKLAELTNCPIITSEVLVECLRKIPADSFVQLYDHFKTEEFNTLIPFSIVPEINHDGAFITKNPWYQTLQSEIPWIVGINSEEGGVLVNLLSKEVNLETVLNNINSILSKWLIYQDEKPAENRLSEIIKKTKHFYFKNEVTGENKYMNLVNLFTDLFFTFHSVEAAQRHKGPTYYYYFNHRNKHTFNTNFGNVSEELGVSHADELINLFYMPRVFPKVTEADDFKVSEKLLNFWINFAKYGDPNSPDNKIWIPVQSENIEHLHIKTNEIVMKKNLLRERYLFLKNLDIFIPPPEENDILKDEL